MPDDMDAARTHTLTTAVMRLVQDHLGAQPQGPFKVFEALNALAVVTATISTGTGDVAQCMNFFKEAFDDQVRLIDTSKAAGTFGKSRH